jgi:SAM-dependent methyltransferase
MHPQAYEFVKGALRDIDMAGKRILEFGSYNVNGSVRPLFAGCAEYVGVDTRPGPDVDIVADAATIDGLGEFDIVVCCEVLEHAPDPEAIIVSAKRSLKPDGLLILTAAGPGRPPHGVMGMAVGNEYYANVEPDALSKWLRDFETFWITGDDTAHDIYVVAQGVAEEGEA